MMGMESYYLTLEIKNLSTKDGIRQSFEQKYNVGKYLMPSEKLFREHIVDDSRFVIDNKAVVSITSLQDITKVTFELCFSNYECNLTYIFDVSKWISSFGDATKLIVLNSEYNLNTLDFDEFKNIILQSFSEKASHFNKQYGEIKADILPQNFYNWVRRSGIRM